MYQEKREYLKAEISVNLFSPIYVITTSDGDLSAEGNIDHDGWT